jgi:hypothetical protein
LLGISFVFPTRGVTTSPFGEIKKKART